MRDLIYLDVPKAGSLLSQAEGGLLQEIRASDESGAEVRGGVSASFHFLKAELGASESGRESRVQTRIMHHDLLTRLENSLFTKDLAIDLNEAFPTTPSDVHAVRAGIASTPYIRVEGWSTLEDFERLKSRITNFNPLMEVIAHATRSSLEDSAEFQAVRSEVESQKRAAEQIPDKNKRTQQLQLVRTAEKQLEKRMNEIFEASRTELAQWIVEGVPQWINAFSQGQFHIRVYPFESIPQFQILANLKRSSFVDPDIEHLLFSYGTRPNVKLTIFGLVTSMPLESGPAFDPMAEFAAIEAGTDRFNFESAFRQAFAGLEPLEAFWRFDRFPNVTVLPIAVYRSIRA